MSVTNACPECGARVPTDAPFGLCPRCLMNASTQETGTYRPIDKKEVATPAPAVDWPEILRALREIDLAPPEEVDRLASVSGDDPAQLARVLVQAGKLTPYQAKALLQGKARGLLIGQYLVEDKLGAGGMGVVFKARHRPSGRVVALKILPPSFGREPETVRRFRREFQIASRLSHPNLVAAIEASEDRGVHYLTMEYIPGYDLDRLVSRGGPMALKLALHCAIQVARGLEAAHSQGVIHRDIKPGNVMIDPNGAVRVLDLGLARVIEATSGFGQTALGTLTQSGAYMGTVDFLAPEQADDAKSADVRADVYSLGCTLYFLLTGKPPFPGETVLKRLMAHQDRPAPSLRAARPEVSEALEEVYLRMMAKRPGDRPQSMSEVVIALEACRTSAREAGDVSVDLKTFARTALKRAPIRGRRGPDASVLARHAPEPGGLSFDPDLRLEDLVGDYRDELGHGEIPEEKLPPIVSRPLPKKPRGRRQPVPYGPIVLAFVLTLIAIGYALRPQPQPESRRPASSTVAVAPEPAPSSTVAVVPPPAASVDRAAIPPMPLATDRLQPGSVWIKPPPTITWTFTILERDGERFKAMFVVNKDIREVNGTIRDGRLRWLARDARAIAGVSIHDNEGEIRGEEIAMIFTDPATGQPVGRYKLRLEKPAPGDRANSAPRFQSLFNGRDLTGWSVHPGNAKRWTSEDGHLVAQGTGDYRQQTFLLTEKRYSDFLLRFEFHLPVNSDSGVALRAEPDDGTQVMEINLRNAPGDPPGRAATAAFKWSTSGRGEDYAMPKRSDLLWPSPVWNEMSIEARGRSLRMVLNGQVVQDIDLETLAADSRGLPSLRRREGRVGFQSHTGTVSFRNIEILELDGTVVVPALGTSGTHVEDVKLGTGPAVKPGDEVTVHYVGRLPDGRIFDDTRQRGQPLRVALVHGQAIKGWLVGLAGMRVGGVRRLMVPPGDAYGERGSGTAIPPQANLRFEVELLSVR